MIYSTRFFITRIVTVFSFLMRELWCPCFCTDWNPSNSFSWLPPGNCFATSLVACRPTCSLLNFKHLTLCWYICMCAMTITLLTVKVRHMYLLYWAWSWLLGPIHGNDSQVGKLCASLHRKWGGRSRDTAFNQFCCTNHHPGPARGHNT